MRDEIMRWEDCGKMIRLRSERKVKELRRDLREDMKMRSCTFRSEKKKFFMLIRG